MHNKSFPLFASYQFRCFTASSCHTNRWFGDSILIMHHAYKVKRFYGLVRDKIAS